MKIRAAAFAFILVCFALFAPVIPQDARTRANVSGEAGAFPEYDPFCFDDTDALCVSASAAVLMEAESGRVIYSKSPHKRLPMASTTKIMTSLLACEILPPDRVVTVTKDTTDIEGSSVYLTEGETLTVRELVYCAMLRSGNDAAQTLAKACGGSVENFVSLMNLRARALGLENTRFANPSGLPAEGHYTTAYDLAAIACAALKNEEFAKIAGTLRITVCGGKRTLINRNKLISLYDGMTGVKTGYTPEAGHCLVTSATRNGVTLVAVTLNDSDQWTNHRKMLDYGFETLERICVSGAGTLKAELDAVGGDREKAAAQNAEDVYFVLPKGAEITFIHEKPRMIYAPVERGDILCRVRVYADGCYVGDIPLRAEYGIGYPKTNLFERLISRK